MIGYMFTEAMYNDFKNKGLVDYEAKTFKANDIKEYSKKYCERIGKAYKNNAVEYDLQSEGLILRLDIDFLKAYLDSPDYEGCNGLLAVLCLDNYRGLNQSLVMVPYKNIEVEGRNEQTGEVMMVKKPQAMINPGEKLVIGTEQWPTLESSLLCKILRKNCVDVGPVDYSSQEFDDRVDVLFNNLNIK